MLRRAAAVAAKLVTGAGAVQLGAAGVALTDKELGKRPEWYQNAVKSLEQTLKATGKYGFIESEAKLNEAEETLKRVVDLNNPEVSWRIARALAEKAELSPDAKKKAELLHDAVKHAKSALANEGAEGISGAHKWYAIALLRLSEVDAAVRKDATNGAKVLDHLQRACKLDGNDPFAWSMLGQAQFKAKDYKEAQQALQKAESIKANFSTNNTFYLAETHRQLGDKEEAKKLYFKVLQMPAKYKADGRAKLQTKTILEKKLKVKADELPRDDDI